MEAEETAMRWEMGPFSLFLPSPFPFNFSKNIKRKEKEVKRNVVRWVVEQSPVFPAISLPLT